TVAYSTNGSSPQIVALTMMKQLGVEGKLVATGNPAAALTQVMTGQIDVGYDGNGGMGVGEFQRGDVRIIATGADVESFRDQTLRVIVVTEDTLNKRRDVLVRFLKAFDQTVKWMYASTTTYGWFGERMKTSTEEAKRVVDLIYPQSALRLGQ